MAIDKKEITKNFEPGSVEHKWYAHWQDKGYFKSVPNDKEPYTIVMPPPNVTGILHMGHCLNNTIQDILIRDARMHGKNACWVPGTDHASIATEAKVVAMLREKGIKKSDLSREKFLEYAWEWKEKYGGIILDQLKKLGFSLDWDRTTFTMDEHYYDSVIQTFIDLHKKGVIYRGKRMINWDVSALTALSDEEVIRKETQQNLYHLKYKLVGDKVGDADSITVATVRPETIMGDVAVAVHPNDPRYTNLIGKKVLVPLINREIPIIADDYVTLDFGTGALKITPAHDQNDHALGLKHGLEIIDVFNDDGTMSEAAQIYVGEERFAVRKKIVKELEEKGFLTKTESYTSEVGYSERTDVVVEPRLSMQWWVSTEKLATPALKAVMEEEIKFYPTKYRNLYRHWMENIKDWCISRQLWWGQRIPAWYDQSGNIFIAATEAEARKQAAEADSDFNEKTSVLTQDEDCLDTWFSSWLWPMEVFKGISDPGNKEIDYYYPSQTLVTAPEIIFFWVARMIMAGYEYKNMKPFDAVYFTGIVRDKQGRKMSKSLGNSPDLLLLIEQYGADATRFGIMIASPAGNDILFDESALEQGRNFCNKMWNAQKLLLMWQEKQDGSTTPNPDDAVAIQWFTNRLAEVQKNIAEQMKQFKLSEALKQLYSLIWDDFCSWYLEWVKPGMDQPMAGHTYQTSVDFLSTMMQLLHPFMPFVTEEIYHNIAERKEDLCVQQYKVSADVNAAYLKQGSTLKTVISGLRDARIKNNIKPKDAISLHILTENKEHYSSIIPLLQKQVNAKEIQFVNAAVEGAINIVIGKEQFYIESDAPIDTAAQLDGLRKEQKHLESFLISIEKKLGNEKFIANAKEEVILLEKKKQTDAQEKLVLIGESIVAIEAIK